MRVMIFAAMLVVAGMFTGRADAALLSSVLKDTTTVNAANWQVKYDAAFFGGVNPPPTFSGLAANGASINSNILGIWTSPVAGTWINGNNISPSVGTSGSAIGDRGFYRYTLNFNASQLNNLGSNIIGTPFSIDVAGDNHLAVKLNGVQLANFTDNRYQFLTTIVLPTIIKGANTLEFVVYNDEPDSSNWTGLHVSNVKGEWADDLSVIPEPASIAMWAGICGLGLVARRYRRLIKS